MTAVPAVRGWCPTLLSPMQSGDGWLARVKPTAATVSADAARLIADAARRHGNGHIDLTSRSNLQVRGLSSRSAKLFAEIMAGSGLASGNASLESIRNVMASPLGPDDPTASFDLHALAREIEAMLAAEPALATLPDKFGIVVDGGGVLPLAPVSGDIAVTAHGNALAVRIGGGELAALCSATKLAETVRTLALASLHVSRVRRESPRRLRPLALDIGEQAIFHAAGLSASPCARAAGTTPNAIGFIPYAATGAYGVGLPFGRIEADALASLAALSERFGDGRLRTTPWRAFILAGVAACDAECMAAEINALGLIADPNDPRLRIFACVGTPSCASATVDARADATRIGALLCAHGDETLHVSGCGKACAHRGTASLTLVGRDGRYDLIRNGAADDRPSLTGLSLGDILALAEAARERVS